MNYIGQINAFYAWLETNNLSHAGRHLWHALMHIANRTGWKDVFNLAISTIQVKTGMSESMIKRARDELRESGLITWAARGGNHSAEYSIIPIVVQINAQFEPQYEPQYEPQNEPQDAAVQTAVQGAVQIEPQNGRIPKPYNTKPNNTTPLPPPGGDDGGEDVLGVPVESLAEQQERLDYVERELRKNGFRANDGMMDKALALVEQVGNERFEEALSAANGAGTTHWNYVLKAAGAGPPGGPKNGDKDENGRVWIDGRWVLV